LAAACNHILHLAYDCDRADYKKKSMDRYDRAALPLDIPVGRGGAAFVGEDWMGLQGNVPDVAHSPSDPLDWTNL
jgi:hypothetical protein